MSGRVNKEDLLISLREKHGQDFVTMSDLDHPSSEFMMRYFATVVAQLGIDIKGMTNQDVMHADHYRDFCPFFQVYMAVQRVCPVKKYLAQFSVLTLIEPKPEDIIYVAAMDNFYDYYFQRVTDHLHPRLQELDYLKEHLLEERKRRTELQHQQNDRAAASSKRAVEQAQMERQIKELDEELQELCVQQLQETAAKREKAVKELRQEAESNRVQLEELEELQEARVEIKALREKLQHLQSRHDEQSTELAEKHSALQEKASRKRFFEECIGLESRATEAVAEQVELAAQVEKRHTSMQASYTELENVLRKLEAVEIKKSNLEASKCSEEEDIEVQQKIIAASAKERKDLERNMQDIQEQILKYQQNIICQENKNKSVREQIQKREEELTLLYETFQKQHDMLYGKADSIKKDLKAAAQRQ